MCEETLLLQNKSYFNLKILAKTENNAQMREEVYSQHSVAKILSNLHHKFVTN
jgi:hypothetical protein